MFERLGCVCYGDIPRWSSNCFQMNKENHARKLVANKWLQLQVLNPSQVTHPCICVTWAKTQLTVLWARITRYTTHWPILEKNLPADRTTATSSSTKDISAKTVTICCLCLGNSSLNDFKLLGIMKDNKKIQVSSTTPSNPTDILWQATTFISVFSYQNKRNVLLGGGRDFISITFSFPDVQNSAL